MSMDILDKLKQLAAQADENLKHRDDITKDAMNHSLDRISMANPDKQGPHLPDNADQEFHNNLLGSVMGSMTNTGAAKALGMTAGEAAANAASNEVTNAALAGEGTMADVARAQANQARAADFADRTRWARLKNVLKR
jgi:hypothetical protein